MKSIFLIILVFVIFSSCKKEINELENLQGKWTRIPSPNYGFYALSTLDFEKNIIIISYGSKSRNTEKIKSVIFNETNESFEYILTVSSRKSIVSFSESQKKITLNKSNDTLKLNNDKYVKN